jgi:signal transduction histidine kinase/DNA-binding response OmpR family regulator
MSGKLASVHLLLVEDDANDADLVRRALLRSNAVLARFDLERVDRVSDAVARLGAGGIDAVLLDLSLPDGNGLESLARVQASAGETPIIVVTGYDDEATAVQALHRGAQDYLLKADIGGRSMARSIVYAIERRRTLDSIRRSQAQLAEAQAIAHLGSFEWNLLTNHIDWSSELLRIHAIAADAPDADLSYEGLLARIHAADREHVENVISDALRESRPVSYEYRIVRPDGEVRMLHTRGRVVADASGRPVRLTGTCQDVTERKKLEEQVLLAGRMAAVGTLSGGVAHEINNPLAYVLSNVDFAQQEVGGFIEHATIDELPKLIERLTDVHEALVEAREGAERVRDIVRSLKTFSMTEVGEPTAPVGLRAVLESSINLAWNEIRHRARLVQNYDEVPPVLGNETRLGQVFVNLLVNAAHAIPEGAVDSHEIRVSVRKHGDTQVCVEIQDNGCGISPGDMKRIFDPFFTTKKVGSAVGLGLSICYSIVHAAGGEITVDSTPGQGSTFRVILRATTGEVTGEASTRHVDSAQRRGKVLVIDDEPMVVATLRRVLSKQHEVTATVSAKEALARLKDGQRFDAVLCDLMMPDMTGMALHAELTAIMPEQAERMIFITGGAFTPRGREFLENVPNPRIEKPFDTRDLLALVRGFVR